MKITDTMVLAVLKKGFVYEAKDVDVNMECNIPLSALTMNDEDADQSMIMKMTGTIGSFSIKVADEL